MNTQVIERTEIGKIEHGTVEAPGRKPSLGDWVRRAFENLRDWQRYRSAVRELGQLDDARLADIGIVRSEIRTVVRQAMQERKARAAGRSEPMQKAA